MTGGATRVRSWAAAAARHRRVGPVVAVLRRDLAAGGSLLAAALAFRLFVWLLPCCLLMTAILGFTASGGYPIAEVARDRGLGPFTVSALDQVASQAERGRYVTGALGLGLLLVAGLSLGRALDRVHGRTRGRAPNPRFWPTIVRGLRYTGVLLVFVAVNVTAPATALPAPVTVVASLVLHVALAVVLLGGDWPPRWRRDLPGAVLLAVGALVLNLVAVLYLPRSLARASQLYGTLGIAATMLVWLALIARLVVLGQVVNAVLDEARGQLTRD
ncbi:hypothetical protein BLA60_10425 [Actinophytocola xinjiangensis]|uniref:Uncharacterized protein n=1 Tax=Actinophytocola xinjiangensis TaxID=485602 RepID=A0A7Z1B0D7_9PSEU|nr:YhjD/YihY/BrkB family envelope integrity protein [Actinophytocola xinjiangensis]OLF12371.1 hypothetical protein BLA60_10425 [Actinophytocola xinjiangensis]